MLLRFSLLVSAQVSARFFKTSNNMMKQKQSSKEYLAPMVEVLNARVERGFQASGTELLPTGSNESLISSGEVHGGSDFD